MRRGKAIGKISPWRQEHTFSPRSAGCRANLTLRLNGHDTVLKGFAVGTAFRWRGDPIVGYYRKPTVNPPLGVLDPSRPTNDRASTNLDVWLDYGRTFSVASKKVIIFLPRPP